MTALPGAFRAKIPHHGPLQPCCPVDCLQIVLPLSIFNALARGCNAPFTPPQTVGDVITLCQQDKLAQIGGLGPHRIAEIRAALVRIGLGPAAAASTGKLAHGR